MGRPLFDRRHQNDDFPATDQTSYVVFVQFQILTPVKAMNHFLVSNVNDHVHLDPLSRELDFSLEPEI